MGKTVAKSKPVFKLPPTASASAPRKLLRCILFSTSKVIAEDI